MDEDSIRRYITDTFEGVDYVESDGNYFYFYNPVSPPDHMFPFVTLMTNDVNDSASNLNRPEVYRLNIGVSRATYQSLFGAKSDDNGNASTAHDFTVVDQIMPHPVYAPQSWVCVVNPGSATFETVKELLTQAYQKAVDRHNRRAPAGTTE